MQSPPANDAKSNSSTTEIPVFDRVNNRGIFINQIINQGVLNVYDENTSSRREEKTSSKNKETIPITQNNAHVNSPQKGCNPTQPSMRAPEPVKEVPYINETTANNLSAKREQTQSARCITRPNMTSPDNQQGPEDAIEKKGIDELARSMSNNINKVTSVLKSMEEELNALTLKSRSVMFTLKQLTESNNGLRPTIQLTGLNEQVESNEKLLYEISNDLTQLKRFSMSMSAITPTRRYSINSPTNGRAEDKPGRKSSANDFSKSIINQLKFQKKIVEWTSMSKYLVLYQASRDTLCSKALNARICGKSNVLIVIVTTEGYAFGSYTSTKISDPPRLGDCHVGNDPKFFVFTYINPHGIEPTKITKKDTSTSIKLFSNKEQSYVIGCDGCYQLRSNVPSHIPSNFAQCYNDTTGKGNTLFVGSCFPEKFEIQDVIAIELSS